MPRAEALQAELAAAIAERDREVADLRAQLAAMRGSGPPAPTVLAGNAEAPDEH